VRLIKPNHAVEPELRRRDSSRATKAMLETTEKVVVIGACTGGTEALRSVLEVLPPDAPGIVIVQHVRSCSREPSQPLDAYADFREGSGNTIPFCGDRTDRPGNPHLLLKRSGARYHVEIKTTLYRGTVRRGRVVSLSGAVRRPNAVAVIMTGMATTELADAGDEAGGSGTITQTRRLAWSWNAQRGIKLAARIGSAAGVDRRFHPRPSTLRRC